jgi:D-alanyl-D-alanine carboxypeptidase
MAWNPGVEGAGGGLVTTSADLVRWGRALYGGQALEGEYLPALLESVPVDPDGSVRYGLGVAIHTRGPLGPTWGHAGSIPGYTSSLRHYPEQGLTVAFQVNADAALLDPDDQGDVLAVLEARLAAAALDRSDREPNRPGPALHPGPTPEREAP